MTTKQTIMCLMLFLPIIWPIVGACVLAAIDDDNLTWLAWAKECPYGGLGGALCLWPVILWCWYKAKP